MSRGERDEQESRQKEPACSYTGRDITVANVCRQTTIKRAAVEVCVSLRVSSWWQGLKLKSGPMERSDLCA